MGKKANEKRKAIFEELEAEGKIKPYKPPKPSAYKDVRRAETERKRSRKPRCCIDKYKDQLPTGFIPCVGCPGPTQEALSDQATFERIDSKYLARLVT